MKKILLLLMVLSLSACRTTAIHNIEQQLLPSRLDGQAYELREVKAAVMKACQLKGWVPRVQDDGSVLASILVRGTHEATVKISYDQRYLNITYVDSQNLLYSDGKIHRNYNRRINNLYTTITQQLKMES
ncbi:hypothetical protein [Spartinivicinus poritis]|uniref:Lipoprotein n=1 Tax=Spartinivicinus poritis TaxID=2994640 RepID=A0ABT5U1U7_9GAMM|nr:hypothetical protein [Spartinivicinus sp. A2-2]MDE1460343.1 hypothetical protein [Spartinivicinus sp. A2-2]